MGVSVTKKGENKIKGGFEIKCEKHVKLRKNYVKIILKQPMKKRNFEKVYVTFVFSRNSASYIFV